MKPSKFKRGNSGGGKDGSSIDGGNRTSSGFGIRDRDRSGSGTGTGDGMVVCTNRVPAFQTLESSSRSQLDRVTSRQGKFSK